jgi:hypothetical protein
MDVDSLDVFLWNDGRKKHGIQIKHRARCVKDLSSLLDNLRTVQSRVPGIPDNETFCCLCSRLACC